MVELHSEHPKSGPALTFSALIPDVHNFRGSGGGRVLPQLHPDGTPNVTMGVLEVLQAQLGSHVKAEEIMPYMAGVAGHPGFVERFDDELSTPGIRIPVTADRALWDSAVRLGQQVIWLHTYGERGAHPLAAANVRDSEVITEPLPNYVSAVLEMPEELVYVPDLDGGTIYLGGGQWSGVVPDVREYSIGGANVLDRWVGSRLLNPNGLQRSPLDKINVTTWQEEWSIQLTDLLSVLAQLVRLEGAQSVLLEQILTNPVIACSEFAKAGVRFPSTKKERQPRLPAGELFGPEE